jgi:CoA:oxalate CoA-transferase
MLGRVAITAVPVKFSAWPDRTDVRASRLGEDNEKVLTEIAGLSADEIRDLYKQGILVRDRTLPD